MSASTSFLIISFSFFFFFLLFSSAFRWGRTGTQDARNTHTHRGKQEDATTTTLCNNRHCQWEVGMGRGPLSRMGKGGVLGAR